MLKLLLIGPLPPPLGGATVLFSQLVEELKEDPNLQITIINTARSNNSVIGSFLHFARVFNSLIKEASVHDIVGFHASNKGALLFAPFVFLVCKYYRKPWLFRGFGGYFHDWFRSLGRFAQWLFASTLLRADAILLETKASINFFKNFNANLPLYWYSNSRQRQELHKTGLGTLATNFIFLGHVSIAKGVDDLIYAAEHIDGISIDVYGPLKDGYAPESFKHNINYRGVLDPTSVAQRIAEYDTLILPSKYAKEGYPGVIIEAYSVGVPVIVSNIGAIPEIVDSEAGILIDPGNVEQLIDAINKIKQDSAMFAHLKAGAEVKAEQFCSRRWTQEYIDICRKLVDCK